MTLVAYLFAAMVAWSPLSSHAYLEGEPITRARYLDIADSVAAVSLDPAEAPLFAGIDGRARTAMLLLGIAAYESGGYRADVQFCRKFGQQGEAGIFQSKRSRHRACWSLQSAARMALEQVRESFVACQQNEPETWLAAYTSGDCRHGWAEARRRWNKSAEYMRLHPFVAETGT